VERLYGKLILIRRTQASLDCFVATLLAKTSWLWLCRCGKGGAERSYETIQRISITIT